jgi:hypothetical protein
VHSPLQTVPLGLLGPLSPKPLGNTPQLFSDTVVPVVGLEPHYNAPLLRSLTSTSTGLTPSATGTIVNTVTLPGGASYWLYGVTGIVTMGTTSAATNLHWRLAFNMAPGIPGTTPSNIFIDGGQFVWPVPPATNAAFAFGRLLPQPLILGSGVIVTAACVSDSVATDMALSTNLLVAALP